MERLLKPIARTVDKLPNLAILLYAYTSLVAPVVKNLLANAGDAGLIPGFGRCPAGGEKKKINAFQYSYLGNSHGQGKPGGLQSMGSQRVGYNLKAKQQQYILIYIHILK